MKRRFVALGASTLTGPLGLLSDGVLTLYRVTAGLPADAVLVHAEVEPGTGAVRLWFEHPSFAESDPDEFVVWCETVQL